MFCYSSESSESGRDVSAKRLRYEAFKMPTHIATDSDLQKSLMKLKVKVDYLMKRNKRLEEKLRKLERERERSSSATRSSQTVPIYKAQEEAINRYIAEAGTSLIPIQKEKRYTRAEDGSYPMLAKIHTDLRDWHCQPADYNLYWTISGYWVRAPTSQEPTITSQEQVGPFKACRIESFIDIKGNIHKALSYGEEDKSLVVWYDLKDIQNTFPRWTIPETSNIKNVKTFKYAKNTSDQEKKTYSDAKDGGGQRGKTRGRGRGREYQHQYDGYNCYDSGIGRGGRRYEEDSDYDRGRRYYYQEGGSDSHGSF